jgi:hypothetical protein
VSASEEKEPESESDAKASEPPPSKAPPSEPAVKKTAYRDDGVPKTGTRKPVPTIWQRATYRWTAITTVMAAMLVLYTQHPYYLGNQFAPFRSVYTPAFVLWLVLGLFYVKATLEKFKGNRYVVRDGGLHLILLAKSFELGAFSKLQKQALAVLGCGLAVVAWFLVKDAPLRLPTLVATLTPPAAMFLVVAAVVTFAKAFQPKRFWRLATSPRIRTTLLSIVVKGFYLPLMVGFFSGHANGIAEAWLRHKHLPGLKFVLAKGYPWEQAASWFDQMRTRLPDLIPSGGDFSGLFAFSTWTRADVSWGLGVAYDITFFIDCGWALIGYGMESRWLGNKTRSVEPTWLGWAAALSCYPPYNNVLGTYLPLENGKQWITGEDTQLWLRGIIVLLFFIYASATVSFGFKFSNLTNRGIISRGPYRLIRHPAYVTKCTAWWLEHMPTMTLTKAFFLSLLCAVYALRAWTEERHLSRDADYREYKKKVPWVIIPGVY